MISCQTYQIHRNTFLTVNTGLTHYAMFNLSIPAKYSFTAVIGHIRFIYSFFNVRFPNQFGIVRYLAVGDKEIVTPLKEGR